MQPFIERPSSQPAIFHRLRLPWSFCFRSARTKKKELKASNLPVRICLEYQWGWNHSKSNSEFRWTDIFKVLRLWILPKKCCLVGGRKYQKPETKSWFETALLCNKAERLFGFSQKYQKLSGRTMILVEFISNLYLIKSAQRFIG